jgi:hypothetical protein
MSGEHEPSLVWIAEGTVQWEAWREHRTNRGLKMPEPFEVKGESGAGWWFPRPLPTNVPLLFSRAPDGASAFPTKRGKDAKPAKRPRSRHKS